MFDERRFGLLDPATASALLGQSVSAQAAPVATAPVVAAPGLAAVAVSPVIAPAVSFLLARRTARPLLRVDVARASIRLPRTGGVQPVTPQPVAPLEDDGMLIGQNATVGVLVEAQVMPEPLTGENATVNS